MLVHHAPDWYERLRILGGMAEDDVLNAWPSPGGTWAQGSLPWPTLVSRYPIPGVYGAARPNDKFINLLQVMCTDFCMMGCACCPNGIYVPRK